MDFGVGLWCLQSTATAPRSFVRAYRELREDAQLIERLGFRDMWLSEHHFFYDGYCPALLPAAASALAVTERLRVATGMLLLPLQDPARVAGMAATLAARSGGRFDLGVGLGYRDVEFDGKGVSRSERVARFSAGLDRLEADAPEVPLWIGSATPQGMARAGARGHGVLLSGANPLSLVGDLTAAHRRGWEEAGRPGGRRPPVAALRNVWVADDEGERAAAADWMRASYVLYAGLGWAVAAQGATAAMDFRRDAEAALADAVATAVIGPAGQVCEGLLATAEAGVDHVVLRAVVEGAPRQAVAGMLRRFADTVMPELAS
jgi:alkanesulfonate monooxygenase SsuD/methylene tetrahydromethanopterin reductase-like flavin-dependent oxidoreductase (luciferase family)